MNFIALILPNVSTTFIESKKIVKGLFEFIETERGQWVKKFEKKIWVGKNPLILLVLIAIQPTLSVGHFLLKIG